MPDRRDISRLLADDHPECAVMSSDELEGYLNSLTGCSVGPLTPNGVAFDEWRQALAKQGKPHLWPHGPEAIEAIKARAEQLRQDPEEIQRRMDKLLADTLKKVAKPKDA